MPQSSVTWKGRDLSPPISTRLSQILPSAWTRGKKANPKWCAAQYRLPSRIRHRQGEYPLYLRWRSAWTVDRFYIRSERFSDTYLRSVWCLLHLWRSIVTCSYDCQCRLCLACHCCDKQSLRWCRKTVPVSTGIRKPAPTLFYLDSHWKRRIPRICNQSRSADERIPSHHFCDNRKIVDYGVRDNMNMGACMAPAAADVIYQCLEDLAVKPSHLINHHWRSWKSRQ